MRFLRFLILFLPGLLASPAFSHPSDVSQMRVKIEQQRVDVRLTLNLLSLSRLVVIDSDHNQRITPAEMAKAAPVVAEILRQKVMVTVNDDDASIGSYERYEGVWPNADTYEVTDQEASERYVDFHFVLRWPPGVQEYWLGFQFFAELGTLHTVQAIYQQADHPDLPVEFSQYEPEYLYDTGWTETDFIKTNAATREFHPWALGFGVLAVLISVIVWVRNACHSAR